MCQSKLEFCRQYFEQIYNAHLKLVTLLREQEGDLEDQFDAEKEVLEYVRTFTSNTESAEEKVVIGEGQVSTILYEPREFVKCEPEIPDLQHDELEDKAKHFLDELLDDYEDNAEVESKTGVVKRGSTKISKNQKSLVPLPLKKCGVCDLVSSTHHENVQHWSSAHPDTEISYKCDWSNCDHKTTSVTEVKKHGRQHMIDENLLVKCKDCDKYYPRKYLEQRHYLVHQTERNFNCETCGKSFKTPEILKQHNKIVHASEEDRFSHCCEVCGRKFAQKANLESHMRTHTGDKPFACDFCSKSFSQKGNLDEHRRTHTGEKPYVCDICGSRHTRKGELLLHVRCIHTHERPFQCTYCPKSFQRRDLLRKHERIHTDTRPYSCEFCGKTFTARDKMVVHRRLHTGERPYICTTCGRGFCESGNLKKHMKVHGTDIPAVVKQNNKGHSSVESGVVKTSNSGELVNKRQDQDTSFTSPASVKSERDDQVYHSEYSAQHHPNIVQHQLFQQLQSSWIANYSQMQPPPS